MNIALLLEAVAAMYPERTAVSDGATSLTLTGLGLRARRRAAWVAASTSGRPLLYVGSSRAEAVELLLGCAIAGSPFVPVNFRVKAAEMAGYLAVASPAVVVIERRYRDLVGRPAAASVAEIETLGLEGEAHETIAEGAGPAVCLFTSGTTGSPKLALLTHDNLSAYVLNTVEAGSAAEGEAALISTPPYHIAWVANVLSNLFRARRLVLTAQFDPREWLRTVAAERVTHAMVVPTMLSRILDELAEHPDLAPQSLASLSYGGARAPEGLIARALELLPAHVGLVNAFGLTETSSTVALLGPEDHRAAFRSDDPVVRARLHSVGRPVPGIELRVVRDDGRVAGPGEPGQLWIRGDQVSPGYLGKAASVDAEGWFRCGDRAYLDRDGYLFVVGREDDVIIRGGENIDPAEIEEVLERHPSVREAVVVGIPDPEWGEVLAALVVGDERTSEGELADWVRARVAGYKVPRRIQWTASLPRNDTGKVVRRAARALLGDLALKETA